MDYNDREGLVDALKGTHTVLSFIQLLSDPDQMSQKNLIDAAISARVKRFAPSEFGRYMISFSSQKMAKTNQSHSKGTVHMDWWQGKLRIREYLEEINAKEQV